MRLMRITIHQGERLKVHCAKCGDVLDSFRGSIWADMDAARGADRFYHEFCKPDQGEVIHVMVKS